MDKHISPFEKSYNDALDDRNKKFAAFIDSLDESQKHLYKEWVDAKNETLKAFRLLQGYKN